MEFVKPPHCVLKPCESNRGQEEESGSGTEAPNLRSPFWPIKVSFVLKEKLSSVTFQGLSKKHVMSLHHGLAMWLSSSVLPLGGYHTEEFRLCTFLYKGEQRPCRLFIQLMIQAGPHTDPRGSHSRNLAEVTVPSTNVQAAILWPRDALSIFEVLCVYPLTSLRITSPLKPAIEPSLGLERVRGVQGCTLIRPCVRWLCPV